ncbi:MAG: PIG-L family deacetylase [Candidatus Doudnabacteria bacterium]
MSEQKTIYALGIVAHPDDESFLFAGTCLKLAAEGKNMAVICATKGEKGADRLKRKLSMAQMAKLRQLEGKKAAKIIKLSKLEFFNYPDGGLDRVDFLKLTARLAEKIEKYRPEIILTFGKEGISGHKDHIVIGKATITAVKRSKYKPQKILLASIPASAIKVFNKHLITRKVHLSHFSPQILKGVPDNNLLKIDIRKYAKLKHMTLKAHESQFLPSFALAALQKQECFEVIVP